MKIHHSTIKCPHCGWDTHISKWNVEGNTLVCPHCHKIIKSKDF